MTVENIEIGGLASDVGGATPGVVIKGDGTTTVRLAYPVRLTSDGDEIKSITMGRIKGRDMVEMLNASGAGDRVKIMLTASAGYTGPKAEALMNALDAEDFLKLIGSVERFLGNGPKTGPSS